MKQFFGTVLFVITISSLSVLATTPTPNTSLSTEVNATVTPPPPTTNDTKTTNNRRCSETSEVYNNATINFYNTLKDMLAVRLNDKTINETADSINLAKVSELYLDALETCPGIKSNRNSHTHFISLIEFSLRNGSLLRDLKQKGQFQCVIKQRSDILSICFKHNSTSYESHVHRELHRSSLLDFNDVSCPETLRNKRCVNDILKQKCASIASYVDGLFEFINQYCNTTKVYQHDSMSSGAKKITAAWATFVVILLEGATL